MKVEYNENDREYMDKVNKSISGEGEHIPIIINDDSFYFIKFKASDYAKANNFVLLLLAGGEVSNELRESLGIEVDSIYISDLDNKKKEIVEYLRQMANHLEEMR